MLLGGVIMDKIGAKKTALLGFYKNYFC